MDELFIYECEWEEGKRPLSQHFQPAKSEFGSLRVTAVHFFFQPWDWCWQRRAESRAMKEYFCMMWGERGSSRRLFCGQARPIVSDISYNPLSIHVKRELMKTEEVCWCTDCWIPADRNGFKQITFWPLIENPFLKAATNTRRCAERLRGFILLKAFYASGPKCVFLGLWSFCNPDINGLRPSDSTALLSLMSHISHDAVILHCHPVISLTAQLQHAHTQEGLFWKVVGFF